MEKLSFVLSLFTRDNDYQMAQAASAELAARNLDVDVRTVFAENDTIEQSQQLLGFIQSRSAANPSPDAIILEPVGATGLPQVARAAAAAGIAWVTLNREVEYIHELRKTCSVPIFSVSCDHQEIGRIQGRQMAALLPRGGSVLYITGPSGNLAASQRIAGMYETKPIGVHVSITKGQWTEESARRAVSSWLHLSTSRQSSINLIAAQNDVMAMGARKAFKELDTSSASDGWLHLAFIGCDGLPGTGQIWVKSGLLAATVIMEPNAGRALELLVKTLRNAAAMPPERILTAPASFPPLQALREALKGKPASST